MEIPNKHKLMLEHKVTYSLKTDGGGGGLIAENSSHIVH